MGSDPWKDIAAPNTIDAIKAKRINADIPWGFFWARSIDNKCLLVLQHSTDSMPRGHLPRLKGIEVEDIESSSEGDRMLVLKLLETAHRDIFHRLCSDIVASASSAASEKEAVETALTRTWRWHHLLRGGSDGRLSSEEQKGLIGELLVLEYHLLSNVTAFDAVSSWHGPLGSPKDFAIWRICIEAKARRGTATPYMVINSEFQLDGTGADDLFLYVVDLDRAPSGTDRSFSVSDVARRVQDRIAKADDGAGLVFEDRLSAAGLRWEDDYSDFLWVEGASRLYRVAGEFPRITASTVTVGVSNVKYSLSLPMCEPFRVTDDVLASALERSHGD